MNSVLAVLILGGIILFHELGHFIFAKLSGIEVTEFSLGMGPRLLSLKKGETRYSLKLLPFGGSCAMLGEDEDAEGDRAFNNKPVFNRIAVVAGGQGLLAFLLSLVIVGCAGGFYEPVVVGVEKGYPAEQVGILPGDVITKVNHRSVHSYRDLTPYLTAHPHQDVTITWKHTDENGKTEKRSAKITPVYIDRTGQSMIGVRFDATLQKITNPAQLVVQSVYEVEHWIGYVFDSIHLMFVGKVTADDISGPVGIVTTIDHTVEQAASAGKTVVAVVLMNFAVLLSANLGVMNLLPLPALDGGRLVFLIIEAIRRKPIDREKEGTIHAVGMIVLLVLMVFILFNDVRKLL
jgi:regulator of sigma E protease